MKYVDELLKKEKIEVGYLDALSDTFKKSAGFILNYGESGDVIPVGTFVFNNFINTSSKPYTYKISKNTPLQSIVVELVNVKTDEARPSKQAIYMPFEKFIKLCLSDILEENTEIMESIGYDRSLEDLMNAVYVMSKYIKDCDKNITDGVVARNQELRPVSLTNLEATYLTNVTEKEPEQMGNNYSLIPVSLGRVLVKKLTKDHDEEKTHNEVKIYNYSRSR